MVSTSSATEKPTANSEAGDGPVVNASSSSTAANVESAPYIYSTDSSGRSSDASWLRMYHNLKAYQQNHNGSLDVNVEDSGRVTNQALSKWVARQRKDFQANSISPARKRLMENLGFEWDETSAITVSKPETKKGKAFQLLQNVYARGAHDLWYEAVVRRALYLDPKKQIEGQEKLAATMKAPDWIYMVLYLTGKHIGQDQWVSEKDITEQTERFKKIANRYLSEFKLFEKEMKTFRGGADAKAFADMWERRKAHIEEDFKEEEIAAIREATENRVSETLKEAPSQPTKAPRPDPPAAVVKEDKQNTSKVMPDQVFKKQVKEASQMNVKPSPFERKKIENKEALSINGQRAPKVESLKSSVGEEDTGSKKGEKAEMLKPQQAKPDAEITGEKDATAKKKPPPPSSTNEVEKIDKADDTKTDTAKRHPMKESEETTPEREKHAEKKMGTPARDSSTAIEDAPTPDSLKWSDINTSSSSEDVSTLDPKSKQVTKEETTQEKQKRWMKCFRMLKRHQKKYNALEVRESDHKLLFHWIWKQRKKHKHGELSGDQKELLEGIGFQWQPFSIASIQSQPEPVYSETTAMNKPEKKRGRGRPRKHPLPSDGKMNTKKTTPPSKKSPKRKKSEEEGQGLETVDLSNWVPVANTDPAILALNEHLPIRTYNDVKKKQWFDGFELCKRYKAKFGTTFVAHDNYKGFKFMYNWTYRQRRQLWEYELSRDRKELLDAMGFDWGADALASASTVMHQATTDDLQIQEDILEGTYMARKRKRNSVAEEAKEDTTKESNQDPNNTIEEESSASDSSSEEDDLDAIFERLSHSPKGKKHSKGDAPQFIKLWLNKWVELKAYKKKNGTTAIGHDTKFRGLYHWTRRQRLAYKDGKLSKERRKLLEKLDFQWEVPNTWGGWNRGRKPSGNDDHEDNASSSETDSSDSIPVSPSKRTAAVSPKARSKKRSYKHTASVASSRASSNKGPRQTGPFSVEYSDDDVSAASITSEGLDKFQKRWLHKFRELKAYRRAHGTLEVRYKDLAHRPLYHWIRNQQLRYRVNDLPADRKAVLNEIGFPWDNEDKNSDSDDSSVSDDDNKDNKGDLDDSSSEEYEVVPDTPKSFGRQTKDGRPTKDDGRWMETYNNLRQYKKKYNTLTIPYLHGEERFLYHWVWRQKKMGRLGQLPQDRRELLEKIGMEFEDTKMPAKVQAGPQKKKKARKVLSQSPGASSLATSHSSSVASSSSSEYDFADGGSTGKIPVAIGKVEDMENYLDSVQEQIRAKEEELKSLHSVRSRVRFLLKKSKPEP